MVLNSPHVFYDNDQVASNICDVKELALSSSIRAMK